MKPSTLPSALASGVCLILCPLLVAQETAPIALPQAPAQTAPQQATSAPASLSGDNSLATHLRGTAIVAKSVAVKFVLLDSVSSATAAKGQPVHFAVAEDVSVDGHVAIPRGTPANGVVTHIRKGVPGEHDGSLTLEPREILLANGSRIKFGAYPPGEDACGDFGPCLAFGVFVVVISPLLVSLLLIGTPELIAHRIREKKKSAAAKSRIEGRDESLEPCQIESAYTSSNSEAFSADALVRLSAPENILAQLDNCPANNQRNSRDITIPLNQRL
jgi:hypothetical protein